MTFLSCAAQQRLQQAFAANNMTLDLRSNCVVVEDSFESTKAKIEGIIEALGLCPLVFVNKADRNFAFTISPYQLPEVPREKDEELREIAHLLDCKKFSGGSEGRLKDVWSRVNEFRSFVSKALDKGLSEILTRYARDEQPIIEIGSGIGYTLPKSLSAKTLRTQPNPTECQLLSRSIADPVYETDIEGLHDCLVGSEKKIPLFFALNVFDVMTPSERKESFSQLSQLQNSDDHIVIMLDTNPHLDGALNYLESLHPGHAVLPYYPLSGDPTKQSVVLIPLEHVGGRKPSLSDFLDMMHADAMALSQGAVTKRQHDLHQLQQQLGCSVIVLEDFFVEQVKSELAEAGYTSQAYYHASFCPGMPPEGQPFQQDLIYKPVTDAMTVRQWSLKDERLLDSLEKKGLSMPAEFSEEFIESLRRKGEKIFGAELLVIAAKKI